MSKEKHYYDPATGLNAKASSRMACYQLIREECKKLGHAIPEIEELITREALYDMCTDGGSILNTIDDWFKSLTVTIADDYTPWKEFSPDILKDGMELFVRTRDGDHHHGYFVEKTMIGPIFAGKEAGVTFHPPYSEITHVLVINPPKP